MTGRLGAAVLLALVLALAAATGVVAAEPTPSAAAGDPRSSGEGPGLVGEPLLAIGVVLGIAILAVVATTVWVRLTAGRSGTP